MSLKSHSSVNTANSTELNFIFVLTVVMVSFPPRGVILSCVNGIRSLDEQFARALRASADLKILFK